MHPQAQYAAEKLLAAGLKRSDFKVRTSFRTYRHNGQTVKEYGDADISLNISTERALELAHAFLKAGLGVTHYIWNEGKSHTVYVHDDYKRQGKLEVIDLDERKRQADAILAKYDAKYGYEEQ